MKKTKLNGVYKGEFQEGLRHGHGTYTYKNGDVYKGEWRKDCMYGEGTLKSVHGHVYDGQWQEGLRDGHGHKNLQMVPLLLDGGLRDKGMMGFIHSQTVMYMKACLIMSLEMGMVLSNI